MAKAVNICYICENLTNSLFVTTRMDTINTAIIGYGRMGAYYRNVIQADAHLQLKLICEKDPAQRELARRLAPEAEVIDNPELIYTDSEIQLVVLAALADSRKEQIERCLAVGKHIISEKPIGVTPEEERELVALAASAETFTTVNLYLRNAWYHHVMKEFVESGQIGDLAIVRLCHMTPGLAPGEGHEYEGPCFHDCGMHYVDIARWYAESEYKTWNAQGVRMWDWKDPWWVSCHGTFENGIVFDITQGFVYGQLSKDQTHHAYVDLIGTKGVIHMTHDFRTARVELRGTEKTEVLERPFGEKNLAVLCDAMARSILSGRRDPSLPGFADAAVASEMAWKMLEDARLHDLPAKGTPEELDRIRDRRSKMTDGYGLLKKRHNH